MIPSTEEFLKIVKPKQSSAGNRLATVTRTVGGRPMVLPDGEADESPTAYAYATGLTFSAGNRVLLSPIVVNGDVSTYIIVCKVTP